MTSYSVFFWCCIISPVKFSYWSKFHVNSINGSEVMTTFCYMGLTRNRKIGHTHFGVLSNIWRLGQVRDTKLGSNVSIEMLHAAKWRVASFNVLEPLRKSQQGEVVKLIASSLPRLRSKKTCKVEIKKSKGK